MRAKLVLQKKKTKAYIKLIEEIIRECYTQTKTNIEFVYNRKVYAETCEIIDVDTINHLLICEKSDTIIFIPIRKLLSIT